MNMFDFNAIQQPTWPVKLKDEAQTVVHLSYPSVDMLDRLTAVAPEIQEIAAKKNGATIRALYGVIAEIMSNNEDCFTFTAEELRDTYRLTLLDVAKFVSGYLDFVKEANEAKN